MPTAVIGVDGQVGKTVPPAIDGLELGWGRDRFHEWLLSLPWVVERPSCLDTPGVRSFAVDCEPLGRRQMWLVTGLRRLDVGDSGIAVILPLAAADLVEAAGWGRRDGLMPSCHVLVTASGDAAARPRDVEALALCAYSYAMS